MHLGGWGCYHNRGCCDRRGRDHLHHHTLRSPTTAKLLAAGAAIMTRACCDGKGCHHLQDHTLTFAKKFSTVVLANSATKLYSISQCISSHCLMSGSPGEGSYLRLPLSPHTFCSVSSFLPLSRCIWCCRSRADWGSAAGVDVMAHVRRDTMAWTTFQQRQCMQHNAKLAVAAHANHL